MKRTAFIASILAGSASIASAATFHTPTGVTSTNSVAYFALNNLIQGPGTGFNAADPHAQLGTGPQAGTYTWVTNAPNGSGDYYANGVAAPVLVFDLGSDVLLSEISTWGYSDGNANGARDFDLRFATSGEGTGGFGTSIANQTGFIADKAYGPRDSNALTTNVTARYVEMTITDNWGAMGVGAGGDRVGLGEVAFEVIPEPGSFALLGLAGFGLLLRRRR